MANTITVNMGSKPCYDIYITKGFDELSQQLEKIELKNRKFAIITDSQVGPIYSEAVSSSLKNVSTETIGYNFCRHIFK